MREQVRQDFPYSVVQHFTVFLEYLSNIWIDVVAERHFTTLLHSEERLSSVNHRGSENKKLISNFVLSTALLGRVADCYIRVFESILTSQFSIVRGLSYSPPFHH